MELESINLGSMGSFIDVIIALPKNILIWTFKTLYIMVALIPEFVRWIMAIAFFLLIFWLAIWCWKNRYAWMEVKF